MLEQRYKELVADIDGIVWEADARTFQFTFVSDQAERLLGYPLEQWFVPGFWASHIHPDDHDVAVPYCIEATATHRKHDFEYRMIAADGRPVWLRDIVSVIVEHGQATKLRGIMVDVTAGKIAEEERKSHVWFLESMDRVNRAMQGENDLEKMMSDVLESVLTILDCDRAWLLHPCDPEADSWRIQMERTRPEFPGLGTLTEVQMTPEIAEVLRAVRAASAPVTFGPGSERPVTEVSRRAHTQSMMCMAVYPKAEETYVFGVHQCSRSRLWTPEEQRLFQEVGRRLADALTSLLVFRNLSESERRLADAEHLAQIGYWERDFVTGGFTLSDEASHMLEISSNERTDDLATREQQWFAALHPDDREKTKQALAAARRGEGPYDVEYRVVRPDGAVRSVQSRGHLIRDESGNPRRLFGFVQDVTDRKRAEAQIFEMNERFRLLSESSLTGIYLIQDGLFRYVNPAFAKMFGYAAEEIMDKLGPIELACPEDRGRVAEDVQRRLEGEVEGLSRIELRAVHKDGSMIPIEVHGGRIEYRGKVAVIGTVIDVSERRKMEDSLRASEARFRTLVDHATDAFFLYDATGTIVDVNQEACESLGYGRQELIGMSFGSVDANAKADTSFSEQLWLQLQERSLTAFESCHRRKDGSTFPVEIRLRPFQERGRWFSVGLARDITERKQAERALVESHNLLNSVVEGTPDAVFVKDLNRRYVMMNSAGTKILGRRVEEVIGKDDAELFPPKTAHGLMELDRRVLTSGQYETGEELVQAGGETRTYLSTKGVLRDAQGNVTGIVGIARDVTELKRLEEQFRQAQKMEAIGRVAGGVAHDFNNLLTVIIGYAELAYLALGEKDPNRSMLWECIKAGERASKLTRQLLAFSRKQVLEPQVVDLNVLIGDLCRMLQKLIGEDVELSFVPAGECAVVKVDPGQFEQTIMNLSVNARDAMPRGGRLTIETRNVDHGPDDAAGYAELEPGRYVRVIVSDSGQGMDATTRMRIFEPFFTTKAPGKGTGLGLAMVYGFVKQSGGHVEVWSELGHGTTFTIDLPSTTETVESAKLISDFPEVSRGHETVLLVEDDEALRRLSKLALRSSGYVVLEAQDGKEALRIAEQHRGPIHILVSDLVMPHMGGRRLTDELTQARPEMRVILMSGYADAVVTQRQASTSKVAFLKKPFSPKSLAKKVREMLDAKTHH